MSDGDRVLLAAFGAGFTWGDGVVRWSLRRPDVSERGLWSLDVKRDDATAAVEI